MQLWKDLKFPEICLQQLSSEASARALKVQNVQLSEGPLKRSKKTLKILKGNPTTFTGNPKNYSA